MENDELEANVIVVDDDVVYKLRGWSWCQANTNYHNLRRHMECQ